MASFKGNGRNLGRNRRRGLKNVEQRGRLHVENLEDRTLLSTTYTPWHPTDTNLADVQNGPMANMGEELINVYQSYQTDGVSAQQLATLYPTLQFVNADVMVGVNDNGGDFNAFVTTLQGLGMQVTASSSTYGEADGWLPISELPAVAEGSETLAGHAIEKPYLRYTGVANNEGATSIGATTAQSTDNLTGQGQTVGVLSDSVSQTLGGLADSVNTGDLPSNVNVVQDGVSGDTDEGRAMLENVHDVAPGASLAFATADGGDLAFSQNITKLAGAGANILVDDIGYSDEPFFQDGQISQAINGVVANGDTYVSAAGNVNNEGYLSNFRAETATVTGLGQGTYMNFAPSGSNPLLPITVQSDASAANPVDLVMQFDQPYRTQEPANSTNGPTSQVDFYVLDASGNIIASSTNNNVATQNPLQELLLTTPGNYFIAMKVVSGANPGHVEFVNVNENADVTVSQQYGSTGGTYYPTSYGHSTGASTIGVGAMPWWANDPSVNQNPLKSEPFSSFGPAEYVFNSNGAPLSATLTVQNPVVTGPDGGNTSFFPEPAAQNTIDTSNPPFPGEPASATNLSQANLPSFFGTSSAAPNVAGVVALMKQESPSLTPTQVRSALIASAAPMNGTTAGTWNAQSGYGLVNAVKAVAAADQLRVSSTIPGNNATLTVAPNGLIFTFNKPVEFSTVAAADLKFTSVPTGVTAIVGAPYPVTVTNGTVTSDSGDPNPTSIEFPFSFNTSSSTVLANGTFGYTLSSPNSGTPVTSADNKTLASYSGTFSLNDTTAPRITNTTFEPRTVNIQFSEPMRASTINSQTVILIYQNGATPVYLNANPAYKVTYNSATESATIDLSGFNQNQLPNGTYFLVVLGAGSAGEASVTDLVGNDLNGKFSGTFPSGVPDQAVTVPPTAPPHSDFIQQLNFSLSAPIITSLQLAPQSDSGIQGDENTNVTQPYLIGQVTNGFLGPIGGLTVLVEFNALHGGSLNLAVGGSGRGYTGSYDVVATTNAAGTFTVQAPTLPEGFITARALVIGQPDSPPLPGLSSTINSSFRIDLTAPTVVGATLTPTLGTGSLLPIQGPNTYASLTTVSLDVQDPNNAAYPYLATPPSVLYPALDPSTVENVSNFTLYNVTLGIDESSYIASATFVQTGTDFVTTPPSRTLASDPNAGRIDLTFSPGLPAGEYVLIAHTAETDTESNTVTTTNANGTTSTNTTTSTITYGGLRDAAGNPMIYSGPTVTGLPIGVPQTKNDFSIEFNIQPQPAYITAMDGVSSYAGGPANSPANVVGGPRSYYQIGASPNSQYINAPPNAFVIDFSNALAATDPTTGLPINFNNTVILARSADSANAQPDGDFGNLGEGGLGATGTGFSTVPVSVQLYDPPPAGSSGYGIAQGSPGFNPLTATRLVVTPGSALPADTYRIYLPNSEPTAQDPVNSALYDIYGNQVDGEFLGNPTVQGYYQDLMPTGTERGSAAQPDLSGDGTAGGAFETGFVVVANDHVVYAQPGYVENPLDPTTMANGSLAHPYPVLAPQVLPSFAPNNANNDPNGGMNSTSLFFEAFTQANGFVDRAGAGQFERSALAAAQYLSASGPVVVIALPGIQTTNPVTGVKTTPDFVLQAPAGSSTVYNDGSASVPFDTMLVFTAGTTVKLENASLFAQNQGSSIQTLGTSTAPVNFTSYKNDTIDGDTNHDGSNTSPLGGDWGGIVFRNYDYATARPSANAAVPVDGTPVGPGGAPAISGADDALSFINFAQISYGGGAVPATQGFQYDSITAFASRPYIANSSISGGGGASDATISGDLNSFREDDLTRGLLVRNTTVQGASINGIWVRPDSTGVTEATDAMSYPLNPVTLGGAVNFVFDDPIPFVLTSQLVIGQQLVLGSGGHLNNVQDRLYVSPGIIVKSEEGAGVEISNPGASLIVGDRNYITGWDALATVDPTTGLPVSAYNPSSPGFQIDSPNDTPVIFTSALDNSASTAVTPAISVLNTPNSESPTPTSVAQFQRWGSIYIASGAVAVINAATFQYGGGQLNVPGGTLTRQVLFLDGSNSTTLFTPPNPNNPLSTGTFTMVPGLGARVMVTNNTFDYNADVPIMANPNAFLAGNPEEPLTSGNPFIHGNVMVGNGYNGVGVAPNQPGLNSFNLSNNSVWTGGDFTYILRNTIIPERDPNWLNEVTAGASSLPIAGTPMPSPWITLTIQSTLPGTVLADGSVVGKPGVPVVVKLQGTGPGNGATGGTNGYNAGAGFLFGVDDQIDPTPGLLVDQGFNDQLRILGIGGDETTGQQQVPAIITSIHDSTVGTTVRGVVMDVAITGDTTAPKAGDGGLIYFGANLTPTYNALDIREGSRIDNADISYITRIELEGGGVLYTNKPDFQQVGNELTVSNSNLSNFSQDGVLTEVFPPAILYPNRTSIIGEATELLMYNDTIANMPEGVRVDGEPVQAPGEQPVEFVSLNNTFYNDAIGVDEEGIYGSTPGPVQFVGMDNIFSNNSTAAVVANGNTTGSILEYNLFYSNGANDPNGVPNFGEVDGNPEFRDPANGNFQLLSNSAAIDAGRSEMSLLNMTVGSPFGGPANYATLVPLTTQVLNATGGTWNGNTRRAGAPTFGPGQAAVSVLTLPGFAERGYADEWEAVLPTDPNGVAGPATNAATFVYEAITGQRDQLGYLRVDDPNVPNVGFGSNPFFDIGAFEYRILTPPQVTTFSNGDGVIANLTSGAQKDIYSVGSVGGLNQSPQSIQIHFSHNLDPNTINGTTVLLEESGGDGIFGNGNSPLDKTINLSGKLSFNSATNVLTINIGASGLVLPDDEYRIVLEGTGSNVITDPQGNALSGTNTLNDDPNNPQLALPSGNGFPGGNFYTTFVINSTAPSLVSGTLKMSAATDTNVLDQITDNTTPSFTGTISVAQPKIDPLAGQTVVIDISTQGNGVFDDLNAGTATTNAQGQFTVSVTKPLPNSPYNVGFDGLLNSPANSQLNPKNDDVNYSMVRVRVIDQSGNVSDTITDPLSMFVNKGALDYFVVDAQAPTITSITPSANAVVTPTASGTVTVSFVTSKNVTEASLASNIQVTGPTGLPVTVNAGSVTVTPMGGAPGVNKGPETVSFTLSGNLASGQYTVTLRGSGSSPIIDIAGNALAGNGTTAGTDYTSSFIVENANSQQLIYVDASNTTSATNTAAIGTRENPYPTIQAAINAAVPGDTIGVLPGVYSELITLKSFIRLVSADTTSTDSNLVAGNALQTIIRQPVPTTAGLSATVTATNLISAPGLETEIAGFTITSALLGDPALGTINPSAVGVWSQNSNILIDRDYIIDNQDGILVGLGGPTTQAPVVEDNVVAGNVDGLFLDGSSNAVNMATTRPVEVLNNDFVFNTVGLYAYVHAAPPLMANVGNNIFFENHDLTAARNGVGVASNFPNAVVLRENMFQSNGASDTNPYAAGFNVGNGFVPTTLTNTPDPLLGNFVGAPGFVNPIDPRPGSQGPATFFLYSDFDLTAASPAINAGLENPGGYPAPATDLLARSPVVIAGKGFPGTGPISVGAFNFQGSGGTPAGGAFRVITTSLASGGAMFASGAFVNTQAAPKAVTVTFSQNVNKASVTPSDLVLAGSGVAGSNPVHATSLTWIDNDTVEFFLSGNYNNSGTVYYIVPDNAVTSTSNQTVHGFTDSIQLYSPTPAVAPTSTPTSTPAPTPTPTPTPTKHPRVRTHVIRK